MDARQMEACAERLQEFLTTMLASVGRAERRHHGSLYVQGLLLDGERKSIEPLARRVPGADVQAPAAIRGAESLGLGAGPAPAGATDGTRA